MEKLQKKYGLWTASAMVVGIVIGSGVFKSAGQVLYATGGNLITAILAWVIGGLIMLVSAYTFSLLAVRIDKSNGIVDYIETAYGMKVGYYVAWFMNFIYYPTIASILSWLSGSIIAGILKEENIATSTTTWVFALIFLIGTFLLNYLSPILAGKWQVSATILKLIPLALIAVVGTIYGLINGTTIDNFTKVATASTKGSLVTAVAITAFAYEGWIVATSINAELKDAKKNLPRALIIGSIVVVSAYLLFFIGLAGVLTNEEAMLMSGSLETSTTAAQRLFGNFAGTILSVLVLVSCLGSLNGLTMAGVRGMHSIAVRNLGPKPEFFKRINNNDVTVNSSYVYLAMSMFWLVLWYGNFEGWWGGFIDSSMLSIVFLYGIYILVYIYIIKTFKDLNIMERYLFPLLSTLGAIYLIYGGFTSDKKMFLYFCIIVIFIALPAKLYEKK